MKHLLLTLLGFWIFGWVIVWQIIRRGHKKKPAEEYIPDTPGDYDMVDYSERPYVNLN